jgi:hypothetical protein
MTVSNVQLMEMKTTAKYLKSHTQIAKACGVNRATVSKFAKRDYKPLDTPKIKPRTPIEERRALVKELAEVVVETPSGRKSKKYGSSRQILRLLPAQPDGMPWTSRTIVRDLHAVGKRRLRRRVVCSRERKDLARRATFKRYARNLRPERIVFSDETWLSTKERTGTHEWCDVESGEVAFTREDKSRRNLDSFQVWASVGWNYKSELVMFPTTRSDVDGDKKAFRLNGRDYNRRCLGKVGKSLPRLTTSTSRSRGSWTASSSSRTTPAAMTPSWSESGSTERRSPCCRSTLPTHRTST